MQHKGWVSITASSASEQASRKGKPGEKKSVGQSTVCLNLAQLSNEHCSWAKGDSTPLQRSVARMLAMCQVGMPSQWVTAAGS